MNIIKTKNLFYTYQDGTRALSNINLEINEGDKVAILGPNGAGKSTLLKIIAGLMFPYEGTIDLMGKPLTKNYAHQIHKTIGFLFQDPDDQIFMPNVWEDVAFGPINLNLDESEIKQRVHDALKHTELLDYKERVPHHLSYGEKKRVAIAGIIAMKPKVLLLDEPTANLDIKMREELIKVIIELDTTLIIATHDVNTAVRLADKAVVINTEQLAQGGLDEVFINDALLEKAHLEAPILFKLFNELKKQGFEFDKHPNTIQEALKILENYDW